MRLVLATFLAAPLIVISAPNADAAVCVNTTEVANVEQGFTRAHVETDIFDGYHGAAVDAWTDDGFNWRLKAYAYCGEGAATVVYKRAAGTDDAFRVHSKAG